MKTQSYLPIFQGFYNTIFEPCEDMEIEYWQEETNNPDLDYDDLDFDYESYNKNVAFYCCDYVEEQLNDLGFNITVLFEAIASPKFYNFSNDSINCTYKYNKEELNRIKVYLEQNKEEFSEYLKNRYTSCSGFTSFYSSNYNTWINEYFKDISTHDHYLASILEFILTNEIDDPVCDMFNDIKDNYLFATLKETI